MPVREALGAISEDAEATNLTARKLAVIIRGWDIFVDTDQGTFGQTVCTDPVNCPGSPSCDPVDLIFFSFLIKGFGVAFFGAITIVVTI